MSSCGFVSELNFDGNIWTILWNLTWQLIYEYNSEERL